MRKLHIRPPLECPSRCAAWAALWLIGTVLAAECSAQSNPRLLDRRPEFDVLWIESGSGVQRVETEIIGFPSGRHIVPDPMPKTGTLEIQRLGQSGVYEAPWAKIQRIELWEQMLLAEAVKLSESGQFADAFEYLAYLHNYYPKLSGLEQASQTLLVLEAREAFRNQEFRESLSIIIALYERNPSHPSLTNAVPAVSNKLIQQQWNKGNYAAARSSLDLLNKTFPKLKPQNIDQWKTRIEGAAGDLLRQAETALEAKDFETARTAARQAQAILPSRRAGELLQRVHAAAPEIRVGVAQFGRPEQQLHDYAGARVARLTQPALIELGDVGDEGVEYRFRWGELSTDEDGLTTTLAISEPSIRQGLTPARVALRLLEMTEDISPYYRPEMATLVADVALGTGDSVYCRWKHPHIRPAALLRTPLRGLFAEPNQADASPYWFDGQTTDGDFLEVRYARGKSPAAPNDPAAGPRFIVERLYEDDEAALAALLAGEIDIIDRAPPWLLQRIEGVDGVQASPYRIPTVHVLTVNWNNRLLSLREFRRALCFAIDRETIVRDVIVAGRRQSGFRALSGPFPAGLGQSDPIGYAYKQELPVRPHQPILARALTAMAQATLDKKDEAAAKAAAKARLDDDPIASDDASSSADSDDLQPQDRPVPELVLAHESNSFARLACQAIQVDLERAGLKVTLKQLPPRPPGEGVAEEIDYDLRYRELAIWEPVVDARALLGSGGLAGKSTAYINLSLARVDEARNWNEASARLKEVHEIAHYDLPVIPLWQTYNHFAHRTNLRGIGRQPVTLYQNVADWTTAFTSSANGLRPESTATR